MTPRPGKAWSLWATAAEGLADIAAAELRRLGAQVTVRDRDLTVSLAPEHVLGLALRTRVAEVLLVRLGTVTVRDDGDIAALAATLRAGWLGEHGRAAVKAHVAGASADRTRWVQGRLQQQLGEPTDAPQVVHLRCHARDVDVAIDAVGGPLHLRGYRLEPGEAPLRETAAAALLQWAGHAPGMAVWDPMCGSGTLAIEAGLAGLDTPRACACSAWPCLPPQRGLPAAVPTPVWAGDLSPQAVEVARRNAERAHVNIALRQAELADWRGPLAAHGLVVSNLPWGVRLGQRADARRIAQRWAAVLRRTVPGWRAAAVVAEPQLAEDLGLDHMELTRTRNGGRAIWFVRGMVRGQPPTGMV